MCSLSKNGSAERGAVFCVIWGKSADVVHGSNHDDLLIGLTIHDVQIHQQHDLIQIDGRVVADTGANADEVVRTQNRISLEHGHVLPQLFDLFLVLAGLDLSGHAVRALDLDEALLIHDADGMTITHVAGVDVELIGLFSQVDVGDLGAKVLLSQLLSLGLVALLQQVSGLDLGRTGGDSRDLTGLAVDLDMDFDGVGGSAGTNGSIGSFLLQFLDVLLGRVRDNTLDNVTNHGQGNTDGGDDLGVLGNGVLQAHLLGAVGDQRGSTAAAANSFMAS